jgi:hypothetical protein
MNQCLDERALLRMYVGDAPAGAPAHVRACVTCGARYAELDADVGAILRALEARPPGVVRPRLRGTVRHAWVPLAAAAAILVALAAAYVQRPGAQPLQVSMRTSDVSRFANDLSTALFASASSPDVQGSISDTADVEAALNGGWPCTRDGTFGAECDNQLGVLLVGATSEEDDR